MLGASSRRLFGGEKGGGETQHSTAQQSEKHHHHHHRRHHHQQQQDQTRQDKTRQDKTREAIASGVQLTGNKHGDGEDAQDGEHGGEGENLRIRAIGSSGSRSLMPNRGEKRQRIGEATGARRTGPGALTVLFLLFSAAGASLEGAGLSPAGSEASLPAACCEAAALRCRVCMPTRQRQRMGVRLQHGHMQSSRMHLKSHRPTRMARILPVPHIQFVGGVLREAGWWMRAGFGSVGAAAAEITCPLALPYNLWEGVNRPLMFRTASIVPGREGASQRAQGVMGLGAFGVLSRAESRKAERRRSSSAAL